MKDATQTSEPSLATAMAKLPKAFQAFIEGASDAVARSIANWRRDAEVAEELRSAEFRAFMAEQREACSAAIQKLELALASNDRFQERIADLERQVRNLN